MTAHYLTTTEEAVPVAWWNNGHPQRFAARWAGRGLHLELGTRAYLAATAIDCNGEGARL